MHVFLTWSDEGSEVHYTFHKVDPDREDLNNLIRMLFDNDNRLPDDIGYERLRTNHRGNGYYVMSHDEFF